MSAVAPPFPLALFLDLDGTLVDSSPGILGCLARTLEECGAAAPPAEELLPLIGMPLEAIFARLLEEGRVAQAAATYRRHYRREGVAGSRPYPGVEAMLRSLHAGGCPLHLFTSKRSEFARLMLERFSLAPFIDSLYADPPAGGKGELLRSALAAESLAPGEALVVGDSVFDLRAARENGVPSLAVSYGYGRAEALAAEGALALCASPAEVEREVRRLGALHPRERRASQ